MSIEKNAFNESEIGSVIRNNNPELFDMQIKWDKDRLSEVKANEGAGNKIQLTITNGIVKCGNTQVGEVLSAVSKKNTSPITLLEKKQIKNLNLIIKIKAPGDEANTLTLENGKISIIKKQKGDVKAPVGTDIKGDQYGDLGDTISGGVAPKNPNVRKQKLAHFAEYREKNLSFSDIIEQIRGRTKEELRNLKLELEIIQAFHNGLKIVGNDTLSEAEALLAKVSDTSHKIEWDSRREDGRWVGEADKIEKGDIIQIKGNVVYKINGGTETEVGKVVSGFEVKGKTKEMVKEAINNIDENKKENIGEKDGKNDLNSENTSLNEEENKNEVQVTQGIVEKKEDKNKLSSSQTLLYENGRVFLVGKNGEKKLQNIPITPEQEETLKGFQTLWALKEVVEIWMSQANSVSENMIFKSASSREAITKQADIVKKNFKELCEDTVIGNEFDMNKMEIIFKNMLIAEKKRNIIGAGNLEKIQTLLSAEFSPTTLPQIYQLMRYDGFKGNSELVKEKLSDRLLNDEAFVDEREILENPETLELIKNNDESKLGDLLRDSKLSKEMIRAYNKMKAKQEAHRNDFAEKLKVINAQEKKEGKEPTKLDDFINMSVDFGITNLLKNQLLYNKIKSRAIRGERDSYMRVYANIVGLGKKRKLDWHRFSDENIDVALMFGSTIALSMVSMGVGALIARGTIGVATALSRTAQGAKILNNVNKLGKVGKIAKFGATAGIEGFGFYEGTNLMNNLIYSEGNPFQNGLNKKEIAKSIAFMGVLKVVGTKMGTQGIQKISGIVPTKILKNAVGIGIEAGVITGTSMGLEIAFEGWKKGNWSWQEYIQALVMIQAFHLAGKAPNKIKNMLDKFTVKKTSSGGIEVTQETVPGNKNTHTHTEAMSETEWKNFVNEGKVEPKRQEQIVEKIAKGEPLSKEELAMREKNAKQIEEILEKRKAQEESKGEEKTQENTTEETKQGNESSGEKDNMSKKEWKKFKKDGTVRPQRLEQIAEKIAKGEKLNERESEIRDKKVKEIEEILTKRKTQEEGTRNEPNKKQNKEENNNSSTTEESEKYSKNFESYIKNDVLSLLGKDKELKIGKYSIKKTEVGFEIDGGTDGKYIKNSRKEAADFLNTKLSTKEKMGIIGDNMSRSIKTRLNKAKKIEVNGEKYEIIKGEKGEVIFTDKNGKIIEHPSDAMTEVAFKEIFGQSYNAWEKMAHTTWLQENGNIRLKDTDIWKKISDPKSKLGTKTLLWLRDATVGDLWKGLKNVGEGGVSIKKIGGFTRGVLLTGKYNNTELFGKWGNAWLPSGKNIIGSWLLLGAAKLTGTETNNNWYADLIAINNLNLLGILIMENKAFLNLGKAGLKTIGFTGKKAGEAVKDKLTGKQAKE